MISVTHSMQNHCANVTCGTSIVYSGLSYLKCLNPTTKYLSSSPVSDSTDFSANEHSLGDNERWLMELGPCYLYGKLRWNLRVLVSNCPNPGHYRHLVTELQGGKCFCLLYE